MGKNFGYNIILEQWKNQWTKGCIQHHKETFKKIFLKLGTMERKSKYLLPSMEVKIALGIKQHYVIGENENYKKKQQSFETKIVEIKLELTIIT